ncbi:retinitis pigmentosa 1-like 1 protein [Leptonychotes weddellii]|uniref:Retinitis pigmentosa 1-like 1 protein n=1 Tax=Leptonychotes weddellii TaxID=9713 RepID=A0A7F8QTC8_LEPWE|nr:retinitis pigmentosa 1-like 1 protein [Leptonychotes weddellii]
MNSTLRDAQAPSHRECLLPSVARNPSVTQVTPAKKITFLKRGDPRFAGVRLAVDQRVFKSFGALMDELSQRVPLSFGVRSVTTPRGLHGLSTLEQLEDGGCYLCSDKKPPKTPSRPDWPQGRSPSAQQSRDFESRCEAPGTSSSCKGPKAPRRIMLVKNGDPRFQQTMVLSHRNTRNLSAFLSKASDLLHFPVKQMYTTSGKKVDSLKGLLRSPSVLVCAGYESFKPLAMEDSRRYGTATLSGQTPRNKTGSWGPKAKQSVIHSRSRSGSQPRRFSLLSERSGLSDPPVSLHHAQTGPAPDRHPQDMPAQLGPLVASDDVEKKVRMNEDGSLSVEMKVRFHLVGEDALLWSRRVGRASALTAASEEVPVLGEVDSLHCVWEDHPGGSPEPGAQGQGPCEAGCEEALGRGRWQPGTRCEIWMNPLYFTQGEGTASRRRSRLTQHSHSRRPCSQVFTSRKRSSKDSVSPTSRDRPPKDSEPNSSCCSRSPEGSVDSCDLHSASGAASQRGAGWEAGSPSWTSEGPGPQEAGQGSREPHSCLKPQTRGTAGALSDSSESAESLEESSERGKRHQGCLSKTRAVTTSRTKAIQGEGPSPPTVSPWSLRNEDSQAEDSGQGTRHSQAKVPGGRRKQGGRVSAVSSPSISGLSHGAQRGHPRQQHTQRHTHRPPDSPVPRQMPGPPSRRRACPNGSAPRLSASSPRAGNRASQDTGPLSSASLHSQTPSDKTHALQTSQPLRSQGPFSEVPLSGAMGKAVKASRRGSSSCGPRSGRIFQGEKVAGGGESLEGRERDSRMALGALPQASPDAVVREWLSNIPVEPIPMKCEMVGESTVVSGDDPEGPKEDPVDKRSPECLGEPTQVRQPSHEGAASEKAEPDGALPVTGDAHPKSEEDLPCSGVSEDPREAGSGKGMAVDCSVGPCVLPHKVSASIQIMKALMGSKQGRPSSLPEVSSAAGRRLSRSAQALITCLAGLHFFDEDLGSPTGKVRFIDSPRYQELLSTFQALWPGCSLRRGELDSGLWELGWCQALPGLRSDVMTEDFTLTSSSGVDVGSGSRGSGEGSGPCAMECALVPERVALPLKIPSQRPDSRTSENREDPGNQQLSGSTASSNSQAWACASRKDEADRNSGGQVLGRNLDQVVENTVQEEEVPLEKVGEEKEIAALQGDGVQGFPEEGRVLGQELSEANSQDGEGAQEDKSVQEEEARRDPASTILCPPGKREKPTELPRSLSERDANASGPHLEPGLEKLPKAAETCHAQAQAKCTQGPRETSSSPARRVSLDPEPLWVSKLLRKMEKAFMAHLGSATAELRARWSLQNNSLLDQMVAELQQDLGLRLRDSTEKELQKIWSQAVGKKPGPAREGLRWEMALQMEQRRRRLQGLRYLSTFSGPAGSQGPGPFPTEEEDAPTLSGALGTWLVGEAEGEEFCPCEACMRKKVIPTSPKDTTGASRAPIQKSFDLQHLLQKKKRACARGEAAEAAPERRGMELLQGDPLGTGTVQGSTGGLELGLDQDPGTEGWGEGENSQTLGKDGDPRGREEEATAQKREGSTGAGRSSVPEAAGGEEQGSGGKEENPEEGSGADTALEGEASGGGNPSPGGQNDGVKTAEAPEAEGEGQPELGGGNQGEEEGSPQVGWGQGQPGETSGNRSPDQEGKPALPPAPGGDSPCRRSGWKAGLASSSTSSLGNCSQLSQKGSVEKPLNGDMRSFEEESKVLPGPERKVTDMYPESSTSEQEEAPLGPRTPEQEAGEASGLEAEKVVKTPAFTERRFKNLTTDRTDGFGHDDLDF